MATNKKWRKYKAFNTSGHWLLISCNICFSWYTTQLWPLVSLITFCQTKVGTWKYKKSNKNLHDNIFIARTRNYATIIITFCRPRQCRGYHAKEPQCRQKRSSNVRYLRLQGKSISFEYLTSFLHKSVDQHPLYQRELPLETSQRTEEILGGKSQLNWDIGSYKEQQAFCISPH